MSRASWPRKLYNYFISRVWFSTIVLTIAGQWLLLLNLAGEQLGLKSSGQLTGLGSTLSWIVLSLTFIIGVIKARADQINDIAQEEGQDLLEIILEAANSAKEDKLRRFIDYIRENRNAGDIRAFRDITQPRVQIARLIDNMQVAFSEIFQVARDSVGISIIYRIDERDWDWVHRLNIRTGLNLEEIMGNPRTAARHVADGRQSFIFHPDKRRAIEDRKYVPGPKDEQYDNIGSIYCQDISISNGEKYLSAILSISTYGIQLCHENDEDAKVKIQTIIMPTFEKRLRLELALMYIKEELSPRCMECS